MTSRELRQISGQQFIGILGRFIKLERKGKEYVGKCPFHDDTNPSFSANPQKGLWHCFGCGQSGNVYHFVRLIKNVHFGHAVQIVKDMTGEGGGEVSGSNLSKSRTAKPGGLTLEQYAEAKQLPLSFLKEIGLSTITIGGSVVRIPYYGEDYAVRATRFRRALDGKGRFEWKSGDKPIPYGVWRLPDAIEAGKVILVEGESDTQTLWIYGIPAIGIPGAGSWKEEWNDYLNGIDSIYVVIEPDAGGEQVLKWLSRSALRDRIYIMRLDGLKDVSDMHFQQPDEFESLWAKAVSAAMPWKDVEREEAARKADASYAMAESLLHDPNLVERIRDAITAGGYAGDSTPALLVYFALTSRLLERPLNLALVGPSSGGKNRTIDAALDLIPTEYAHVESAGSARSLVYADESFEHRVVVIAEADSIPDEGSAASAIRSLAEDSCMNYHVVERDSRTGRHVTRAIVKPGPTGFITTSTRSLPHQMATRMLELTIKDDEQQTRDIILAHSQWARRRSRKAENLEQFLALQTWLQNSPHRVVSIPYATALGLLVPPRPVRIRRDYRKLLSAIMTSTLLHQRQREFNDAGELVATLNDYAIARDLLGFVFESIQSDGLTDAIRETVEAIPADQVISQTDLAERLKLSKSTVSYRVKRAQRGGWIVNEEIRRGHPAKLKRGTKLPSRLSVLPTPEEVAETFEGMNGEMFERPTAEEVGVSPPPSYESEPLELCKSCKQMHRAETLDKHGRCPACAGQDRTPF